MHCFGNILTNMAAAAGTFVMQVASNTLGVIVGVLATLMSAMYQIWAGAKQKELQLNGNQLLHQAAPSAVVLLSVLIPIMEPVGFSNPVEGTLLGYQLSPASATAILISSVLGLIVTLSAFLIIGATSALTYNIVGHTKTVLIVGGGILLFGDVISTTKMVGLTIAMAGIIWYSTLKTAGASSTPPAINTKA